MTVNDRIKILRESLELSQSEFADVIDMQRNSISLIENKKRNPSEKLLRVIANRFNANLDWLKDGEGNMFSFDKSDSYISYVIGRMFASDDEVLKRTFLKICKLNDKYLNMLDIMLDNLLEDEAYEINEKFNNSKKEE